jgi:predicted nucleic acid-binding protein
MDRALGVMCEALPAQVLAEFSSVAMRKLTPPLTPADVEGCVRRLVAVFPVIPLTEAVVIEAVRGVREYGFSYYDAQIWAAARLAGAVLIEDFNVGATSDGVSFVNPFVPDAPTMP